MKPTMELLMAGLFPDGALEELAGDTVKKMCLECGKPIEPNRTGRPRKFCSDKCRSRWHSKHPSPQNWTSTRVAVCPQCGREFLASRESPRPRKYCSRACANRARAKKPETEKGEDTDG
ncbi:MAG: DUF2116 family Zn-ribbon domain-containing protein [Lachnospiraceae bacterium]|nr:DUF2116 family Zn-ribbon domain-containing protein [Lachnospiraceae bacterium]